MPEGASSFVGPTVPQPVKDYDSEVQSSMTMSTTARFSSLPNKGSKVADVKEPRAIRAVVALVGVSHSASLPRKSTLVVVVTGLLRANPTHD